MKDTILRSTLRSFLIGLGVTLGFIFACTIAVVGFALLLSEDKNSLSSNVKIRPDAEGHRKELSSSTPVLLEIPFKGEIGKEELTADKIEEILLRSREKEFAKDRVKGILLVIDSPGGSASDSDMIYNLLVQYKKRHHIPIFAYLEGMCASGGYYIACAADKIYASDSSLIGSIGVISWPPYFNINKVMEKLGVDSLTLSAGIGKDTLNPFRPWKEGEGKHRQELINFFYGRFVEVVSASRPLLTEEKLRQDYGAEVFSPPKAKELGYIDEWKMMPSDAIKDLATASGIKEKYQVVTFQTKSWWKKVVEEKSSILNGKLQHELILPKELSVDARNPYYYLYRPN